jgi:hypothetical protein
MARLGRSTVYLTGAGVLVLVAAAAFLILDLGGRSVDPSSLPVIQLGQSASGQTGTTPGDPASGPQQSGGSSSATSTSPGSAATRPAAGGDLPPTTSASSTSTGATVRETINGGFHTGTTAGAGSTSPSTTGGSRTTRSSTATTGGR